MISTSWAAPAESVDELVHRGVELRKKDKIAEALEMFERAHAVAPSPRTLGQIGMAEQALDRWVEASDHIAGALAAGDDPWVKRNRAALEAGRDIVAKHVGEIALTGPAGVEVFANGKRVGTLPLARPLKLVAGQVVLRAVSPDYEPFATTVGVIGGGRAALTLALTSTPTATAAPAVPVQPQRAARPVVPPPAVPPPSPLVDSSRTWKTPTGVAVGLAGVGLLAWGIVWIAIDGHVAEMACPTCAPNLRNTSTPGWLLAGTGTAAMLGGGLLVYSDGSGTRMAIGATTSGLRLAGRF